MYFMIGDRQIDPFEDLLAFDLNMKIFNHQLTHSLILSAHDSSCYPDKKCPE